MRRRRRLRLIVGWSFIGSALLVALVWLATVPLLWSHPYLLRWRFDPVDAEVRRGVFSYYLGSIDASHSGCQVLRDPMPHWVNYSERFGLALPRSLYGVPGDLTLPLWAPVALLSGIGAILLVFRTKPAGVDVCRSCHYDLTGNTSGVCPECGNPTSATGSHESTISKKANGPHVSGQTPSETETRDRSYEVDTRDSQ